MKKLVFVSGGSRGIGWAICRKFLEEGYRVATCGRNRDALEECKKQFPDLGIYVADVSNRDEINKLSASVLASQGEPDIIVNNAGFFEPGYLHLEEEGFLEKVLNTNLIAAYHLSRSLMKGMLFKASGDIINICSTASVKPFPNGGSYSISKFGLYGFSKVLREELKGKGIRVMAVLPGAVDTDSWDIEGVDRNRLMPAADIAQAVWDIHNLSPATVVEEILLSPQLGDVNL